MKLDHTGISFGQWDSMNIFQLATQKIVRIGICFLEFLTTWLPKVSIKKSTLRVEDSLPGTILVMAN